MQNSADTENLPWISKQTLCTTQHLERGQSERTAWQLVPEGGIFTWPDAAPDDVAGPRKRCEGSERQIGGASTNRQRSRWMNVDGNVLGRQKQRQRQ